MMGRGQGAGRTGQAVAADPRYEALVARRSRLGWTLSAVIFVAFVGYLLLIAFRPALLATPVGTGITSLGIPLGLGLILLAIALTGLYVRQANRHHDAQMAAIIRDHGA